MTLKQEEKPLRKEAFSRSNGKALSDVESDRLLKERKRIFARLIIDRIVSENMEN